MIFEKSVESQIDKCWKISECEYKTREWNSLGGEWKRDGEKANTIQRKFIDERKEN